MASEYIDERQVEKESQQQAEPYNNNELAA
jgi:hypothetical protein